MSDERDLELAELRRDNAQLREDVLRLHRSLSWRLTSPLRLVANALRRGKLGELLERRPAVAPPVEAPPRPVLFDQVVVIFALLPSAQLGGGQRSAQLARAIARRGNRVRYVYAADSFNFERGAVEDLPTPAHLALHCHVSATSPREMMQGLPAGSTFIFEAPHPRFSPYLEAAKRVGIRTVFELIDDWDTSLGAEWYDARLLARFATCEVVTGTAKSLQAQLVERHGRKDALYVPNAADEEIFRGSGFERPPEFEVGRRALLYIGTLSGDWLSWEHLEAAGRVPGARVYLIGDLPHQKRLPEGVVSLGTRDVTALPRYLAHADAALIPFKLGKVSDAVSPIKVFEYLFMGCPVVATSLPELVGMPGVSLADEPEAFAQRCLHPARPTPAERDAFVMHHNWSARAECLIESTPPPRISWLVFDRGTAVDLERCLASITLHGGGGPARVVSDATAAELAEFGGCELVGLVDSRVSLLSPTPLRQIEAALRRESGAVAVDAGTRHFVVVRSVAARPFALAAATGERLDNPDFVLELQATAISGRGL